MESRRIEGLAGRVARRVCAENLHPAYKRLNKIQVQVDRLERDLNEVRNDHRDEKKLEKDLQDVIEAMRKVKGQIGSIEDGLARS